MAVQVVRHYLAHTLKPREEAEELAEAHLRQRWGEEQVAMLLSTRPRSMAQASAEAEEGLERVNLLQPRRFLLALLAVPTYWDHQRQRPEAAVDVA
jgi:hypothetical protein